jgi:putative aminopeptidase FrvX
MKFNIDMQYLLDTFKKLVYTPSPVGYSKKIKPVVEEIAAELGLSVSYDNRESAYITFEGEDTSKTVLITAHLDTLGLMVRKINADGTLLIRKLGGTCLPSIDGETVTVHTRDGREYTGTFMSKYHSCHVFPEAHTAERNEDSTMILLDMPVSGKAEVEALGIQNGDMVSIDPRCQITENGYLKSRFIDDKAAVAICFAAIKYMKENNLKPKFNTVFLFTYYEEIGVGGSYMPEGISEAVAIDIGLIGPELCGNERSVSICAKDASNVYNYEMTGRLIEYAKKAECGYAVDLFFRYGSDAGLALKSGNNVKIGLFGMAVYGSHCMERTHTDGLMATANLALAYILDI